MAATADSRPRARSIVRRRGLVHAALILGFVAAFVSLAFLTRQYFGLWATTDHAIVGLIVLGLVIVHLGQRRRTVRRLLSRLAGWRPGTEQQSAQAVSDLILWLLTLNAMASGVADFLAGHAIILPVPGPDVFQKWHALSVLVLIVYVIVHVVRRRKRLVNSRIM